MGQGKKCRCKNGSYSTRCCSSTRKATKTASRPTRAASSGPISPQEFLERRARHKAIAYVVINPYARRAGEYLLYQFDRTVLRRLGVREVGTTTRVLYGTTRVAGRVATKFVPIAGQVSLAIDAYQFGRWVHDRYRQ